MVFGKVAWDHGEVEAFQDRAGRLALKQESKAPRDKVIDRGGIIPVAPSDEIGFADGHGVMRSVTPILDHDLAHPAVTFLSYAYGDHLVQPTGPLPCQGYLTNLPRC